MSINDDVRIFRKQFIEIRNEQQVNVTFFFVQQGSLINIDIPVSSEKYNAIYSAVVLNVIDMPPFSKRTLFRGIYVFCISLEINAA